MVQSPDWRLVFLQFLLHGDRLKLLDVIDLEELPCLGLDDNEGHAVEVGQLVDCILSWVTGDRVIYLKFCSAESFIWHEQVWLGIAVGGVVNLDRIECAWCDLSG